MSDIVEHVGEALREECFQIFGAAWSYDNAWRFARAAIRAMKPRVRVKMGRNVVSTREWHTQCRKKTPHDTMQQAFDAMMANHGKRPEYNIYECPHCQKWHVGHRGPVGWTA